VRFRDVTVEVMVYVQAGPCGAAEAEKGAGGAVLESSLYLSQEAGVFFLIQAAFIEISQLEFSDSQERGARVDAAVRSYRQLSLCRRAATGDLMVIIQSLHQFEETVKEGFSVIEPAGSRLVYVF